MAKGWGFGKGKGRKEPLGKDPAHDKLGACLVCRGNERA